jgi:hypothetical protein
MRWLLLLMLLVAARAAAQAPPPGVSDALVEEAVLQADRSATVWINGVQVELAVSTGTVDHVTLNDATVRRIGLTAVPQDNKADLMIGGVRQLSGRHGGGWLAAGGRLQRQQLYWFPGGSYLPLAGSIGPFALPHDQVRVEWQAGRGTPIEMQLVGGIDRAAYGLAAVGRTLFVVGADVRMRRPLPLVTAALGADLAEQLGGRLVGEPWQEEIMLGVRRPVRRLELDRPLEIGPIRIRAVAVRTGGQRDATVNLAPGQKTPFDAEEDPEVIQVRGRIIRQRRVARYIMLSRTQLEAHGCTSLTVAKSVRRFVLECGASVVVAGPVTETRPVPIAAADALVEPVLPPQTVQALALGQPVRLHLGAHSRDLVPGDAGPTGLLLNSRAAGALLQDAAERLRRNPLANGLPAQLGPACAAAVMVPKPGTRVTLPVRLGLGGVAVQAEAGWREQVNDLARDGHVSLAALPASRLQLTLADGAAGGVFALPLSDRSHDQSVQGVATLPGIETLFVGLEPGEQSAVPLVSRALADDLARLHGGRFAGERWFQRRADGSRRSLRLMGLAYPLAVGPFRLAEVAVIMADETEAIVRRLMLRRGQPWPEWHGVAGLERELRLPEPVLRAAGCVELVVDKPARSWALRCASQAPSAPPAGPALPGG